MNERILMTESEVDELTDIHQGKGGQAKYALQRELLRSRLIPFTESARGRPVIAIAAIEGRKIEPIRQQWQPKLATA
mgnify:CR=1 FL=1|tara:strand:- start:422294 stop:422524 length:231 start_codon:yes stop_codon:yes gene_type:complete